VRIDPLGGDVLMALKKVSDHRSFGSAQQVWSHESEATGCKVRFGLYLPPQEKHGRGRCCGGCPG